MDNINKPQSIKRYRYFLTVKIMMNDKELMQTIDQVTCEFHGQLDHLYEVIGMIVAGRLLGWRVMRLVSTRRCWTLAGKLFGDPKLLMPERGRYYDKSVGMKIIDTTGEYWSYIQGHKPISLQDRKMII